MSRKIPVFATILAGVVIVAITLILRQKSHRAEERDIDITSTKPSASFAPSVRTAGGDPHEREMQGTAVSQRAPVSNRAAKEFRKSPRGQGIDDDQTLSASSAGERTPSRTKSLTTTGAPEGATRRLSRDERLLRHWDERLRSDFLPFYESASLDPLIRERVHSLLLDQRLTVQDIYDLSRKQNLTYEQHSKLRSEVTDELNTSLQGFLSPDQYAEFSKHNHMLIATELANTTLRQLSARNIPYTDDTSEKLITILKAFPPGRFKYDPMTSHIAKKQLSPQQAAVLEEILDKGYLRH